MVGNCEKVLPYSNYTIDIVDLVTLGRLDSGTIFFQTQDKSWNAKVPGSKLELM